MGKRRSTTHRAGQKFQELRCPSIQESTINIEIGTSRWDGENHPGEIGSSGRHYGLLFFTQEDS